MNVSYKPQKISPKSTGTVCQLLHSKIRDSYVHPQFITDVIKPLQVDKIMDQEVQNLSGGELQRVALTMALGKVRKGGRSNLFSSFVLSFNSVAS
jgi:ATP-binding cassette subfamily E protein 1